VVRLLPSSPAALAIGFARQGRVPMSLVALAAALVLPVVVVVLWSRALERVLTTAGGAGSVRAGDERPLLPRWLPFLPRNRTGAVAAKELRLTWRDPRQRVAVISSVFAAVLPAVSLRLLSSSDPRLVLAAALPAYVLGANTTNLYGFDGQAHWTNVAAGDDARSDLLGKDLARALVALPIVVLAVIGLSARAGTARYALPALGLAAAGFGVNLGLGTLTSVLAPLPMPDNPANLFSTGNTGRGLAAAGPALGVLFGGVLLLAPLFVPLLVVHGSGRLLGLAEIGVLYGFGGWRVLFGLAVRRSSPRQPELLEALSNKHAG
jgi:ABC-2 type transport system permease protein